MNDKTCDCPEPIELFTGIGASPQADVRVLRG